MGAANPNPNPPESSPLPQDVEAVEPGYFKNLKWMLENDITDVFDLNFTAEKDYFGRTEVVELFPGGTHVPVTEVRTRSSSPCLCLLPHLYVVVIARPHPDPDPA